MAIENKERRIFGFQFHPEVMHTEHGMEMIKHFLIGISQVPADWNMGQVLDEQIKAISTQVRARAGGVGVVVPVRGLGVKAISAQVRARAGGRGRQGGWGRRLARCISLEAFAAMRGYRVQVGEDARLGRRGKEKVQTQKDQLRGLSRHVTLSLRVHDCAGLASFPLTFPTLSAPPQVGPSTHAISTAVMLAP